MNWKKFYLLLLVLVAHQIASQASCVVECFQYMEENISVNFNGSIISITEIAKRHRQHAFDVVNGVTANLTEFCR